MPPSGNTALPLDRASIHARLCYIPKRMHAVPSTDLPPVERLRAIVHILRAPGGCPWDIEQTNQSLIPNVLEEAYEVAEAIRSDNTDEMREELGDLAGERAETFD